MKIGLIHYSGPPMVGGVEQTLYHHATELARLGHQPRLIVGVGEAFDDGIPVQVIPALYSKDPRVLAVKAALDSGDAGREFQDLHASLVRDLEDKLLDVDVLILHNFLTLHKNLALTAAVHSLLTTGKLPRTIGWHHDFAWLRPEYRAELHDGSPWDLLKKPWPGVINVVVSRVQRTKLASLYDADAESIHVIPPGIDLARLDSWTDLTRRIVEQLELLQADALLLLPARLTRRKNIEFGLQVLSELRRLSSKDVRLLITGPPGPHNPANVAYLEQLLALRSSLGLENAAHFLYQLGEDDPLDIDDVTMGNLFSICDALFFPSLDEGFGIPLLEARLSRMPIFCSDIAALHESGDANAYYFDPQSQPQEVAADVADRLLSDPLLISRAEVRHSYSWPVIVADKLVPLLEGLDDV